MDLSTSFLALSAKATKIGGPSHGFDYETQCILPLLCNARHKVILLSDPSPPAEP